MRWFWRPLTLPGAHCRVWNPKGLKSQGPSSNVQGMTKFQIPILKCEGPCALDVGIWSLGLHWTLGFGNWSLLQLDAPVRLAEEP